MSSVTRYISESGNDGQGRYWKTSYASSHNNDIMDNFRIDFYEAKSADANGHYNTVTVKLGTTKTMEQVLVHESFQQVPTEYYHLVGDALASIQRIFDAAAELTK